jgi:hypothetical protein
LKAQASSTVAEPSATSTYKTRVQIAEEEARKEFEEPAPVESVPAPTETTAAPAPVMTRKMKLQLAREEALRAFEGVQI